MATHFSSEAEWKLIKKAIDQGKSRGAVMEKYDIGRSKYYRMRKSTSYENYKKLTHDATIARAELQKRSDAKRHGEVKIKVKVDTREVERAKKDLKELDEMCRNAEYNRRTPYFPEDDRSPVPIIVGAAIAVALFVIGVIILIVN